MCSPQHEAWQPTQRNRACCSSESRSTKMALYTPSKRGSKRLASLCPGSPKRLEQRLRLVPWTNLRCSCETEPARNGVSGAGPRLALPFVVQTNVLFIKVAVELFEAWLDCIGFLCPFVAEPHSRRNVSRSSFDAEIQPAFVVIWRGSTYSRSIQQRSLVSPLGLAEFG